MQVANTDDGHRELIGLAAAAPGQAGRHRGERRLRAGGRRSQLRRDGFVVVVLQPAQVTRLCRGFMLQRAKNDRIDAALIAACTVGGRDDPCSARSAPGRRLAEHLTLIEQLVEDIARLKTRSRQACAVIAAFGAVLERRDRPSRRRSCKQRARNDWSRRSAGTLISPAARADRQRRRRRIARPRLAILVRMPEIGRLTREQAAALAGLAPYDDESGEHDWRAPHRGRPRAPAQDPLQPRPCRPPSTGMPQLIALYRRLTAKPESRTRSPSSPAPESSSIFANAVVARGTPWMSRAAAR